MINCHGNVDTHTHETHLNTYSRRTRVYECVYRERVAFQCIHSHCRRLLVSPGERLQSLSLLPFSFASASCGGPPLFPSSAGPVSRRRRSLRWGITVMTSGGSLSASCEGCRRRRRRRAGLHFGGGFSGQTSAQGAACPDLIPDIFGGSVGKVMKEKYGANSSLN